MRDNVVPLRRPGRRHWQAAYRLFWNAGLDRLTDYVATLSAEETKMSDLTFDYPADQPVMITSRSFAAPRALVWKCFSEPQHIARWWGPKSIAPVTRIESFEFRPGGKWRYVCQRPDGTQTIVFYGTFQHIEAPERIVNSFAVEQMYEEDPLLNETHTFSESAGRTFYRAVSYLGSFEARDAVVASGMEKGARESMAQLDELIAGLMATEQPTLR